MAWNEDNLDSAAAYCQVPLASAVDVASQDRQDGIQYRVGVYQVGAPAAQLTRVTSVSAFSAVQQQGQNCGGLSLYTQDVLS